MRQQMGEKSKAEEALILLSSVRDASGPGTYTEIPLPHHFHHHHRPGSLYLEIGYNFGIVSKWKQLNPKWKHD